MRVSYDHEPSVLEAVGNGSYRYRYSIEESAVAHFAEGSNEPVVSRTEWLCDEVIVWGPLTSNKITEAVISSICPASHEQKLVNEFNAANLGLIGGSKTSDAAKERIAAYKEFLQLRAELKATVDADCAQLGIA